MADKASSRFDASPPPPSKGKAISLAEHLLAEAPSVQETWQRLSGSKWFPLDSPAKPDWIACTPLLLAHEARELTSAILTTARKFPPFPPTVTPRFDVTNAPHPADPTARTLLLSSAAALALCIKQRQILPPQTIRILATPEEEKAVRLSAREAVRLDHWRKMKDGTRPPLAESFPLQTLSIDAAFAATCSVIKPEKTRLAEALQRDKTLSALWRSLTTSLWFMDDSKRHLHCTAPVPDTLKPALESTIRTYTTERAIFDPHPLLQTGSAECILSMETAYRLGVRDCSVLPPRLYAIARHGEETEILQLGARQALVVNHIRPQIKAALERDKKAETLSLAGTTVMAFSILAGMKTEGLLPKGGDIVRNHEGILILSNKQARAIAHINPKL